VSEHWYIVGQLLPSVFKSNAWGILHTLLEMFSYRLHHIQPHYRIQLLSQLHQLAQVQQMTQYQLHLWYATLVSLTKSATSLGSFKHRLKTELFSKAYPT